MADIVLHGTEIGGVAILDATTSETHDQAVEVTEFPVEAGSPISDHTRPRQFSLAVQGVVSAAPLDEALSEARRIENTHRALLDAANEGVVLTVVAGLFVYENMVIRDYSAERSGRGGRALYVSLDLVQVRIAEVVEVELPPAQLDPATTRPDGQSKLDAGTQTGTRPDEVEEKAAASGLKQITGGGSVLGGVAQAAGGLFG